MPKKLSSPATGKQKNATSGRPVRSTRGTGGQRAQLERTSVIVGEGLLNKVTGQKRDRNNLVAIPENLSENDLAPPIPAKRARTTKTVPQQASRTRVPDQPLQAAPKPVLIFATKESPYGFPTVSGSQPAGPNRKALLSKTNAQVYSNESDDDMGTRNSKTEHDVTGGDADDNGDDGGDHHNDGDNDRVDSVEDDYDMDGDRDGDDRRSDDNDGGDGGDSHSQDVYIDEVSPSEDERVAEALLRDYRFRDLEKGTPRNVLAQSLKNNRSKKLPEWVQFSTAALHQANKHGKDSKANPGAQESDDKDQDEDQEEVPPRKVLAQYHRKTSSNKPPESARLSTEALHQANKHGKDSKANPGAQESNDKDQDEDQEEVPPRNVLAQYHRKNGSNKPPESARLSTAALHQASQNGKDNPGAQESDDEDQPEDEDQARAARHSKSNGEAKPDTMAYYKGTPWWAILMKAKIKYRRHIALNHGFPDREEHLCDARDILLEEIEEFKEGNGILDNYQSTRAMECLIFKEGATFRGRLKAVANLAVEKAFRDDLNPPDGFESQRDLKYAVEQNVANLLLGSKYLQNGKDDSGRTNNLSHPCLREICITFFYTSKNALARTFPDDFKKAVPDNAIALAATAMRHCLMRYATGVFIDCKFEGVAQNSVYSRMLALILQLRTDAYHKGKHNNNRRQWANLGMQRLQPETEVETHDLHVVLD